MTHAIDAPSLEMLQIAQPRNGRAWLRRILLFITCVLVLDALFGEQGLAQTLRARRDRLTAEATLTVLRNENAGLREQIRRLQEDPATIEAVARQDLGLIRPGEILVVVKDLR